MAPKPKHFAIKGMEGFAQATGAVIAGIMIYEFGKRFFGYKPKTP